MNKLNQEMQLYYDEYNDYADGIVSSEFARRKWEKFDLQLCKHALSPWEQDGVDYASFCDKVIALSDCEPMQIEHDDYVILFKFGTIQSENNRLALEYEISKDNVTCSGFVIEDACFDEEYTWYLPRVIEQIENDNHVVLDFLFEQIGDSARSETVQNKKDAFQQICFWFSIPIERYYCLEAWCDKNQGGDLTKFNTYGVFECGSILLLHSPRQWGTIEASKQHINDYMNAYELNSVKHDADCATAYQMMFDMNTAEKKSVSLRNDATLEYRIGYLDTYDEFGLEFEIRQNNRCISGVLQDRDFALIDNYLYFGEKIKKFDALQWFSNVINSCCERYSNEFDDFTDDCNFIRELLS